MKTQINILAMSMICVATFALLFSCSKDDGDTTPPVINLIEPEEAAVLKIGSNIHFAMELSDNDLLSSYLVEIHSNFDGHGHTKSVEDEETEVFYFKKSWDVSGEKNVNIHHHEIAIPENATSGNYHLMVYCTDVSGNESSVSRNIVLCNDNEEHEH